MSADNGIYILEMKDQVRVIHTQCIENLWWSTLANRQITNFVPTQLVLYFGGVEPMTLTEAHNKAREIYNEIMEDDFCPIVEYGIVDLKINKTWKQIVHGAKLLAPKEIKYLMLGDDANLWEYEIKELQDIIDMEV